MSEDRLIRIEQWIEENPLRRARAAAGLSIHRTASHIGVSPSSVQQWEAGAAHPSEGMWERLALLCGDAVEDAWLEWEATRPN